MKQALTRVMLGAGEGARRGLTLVELLVATGLFSIIAFGLFGLLSDFLRLWNKSETRRSEVEQSMGVAELLAADLAALESGAQGDFVAEWIGFDTDGNNVHDTYWPRLRFVRPAAASELDRMQAGPVRPGQSEQLEVVWLAVPSSPNSKDMDRRAGGTLLRGTRRRAAGAANTPSVFDDAAFFSAAGQPIAGATQEVSGGLLWWGLRLASQSSQVLGGSTAAWQLGDQPGSVSAAWDAWGKSRPDADRHVFNDSPECSRRAGYTPRLPRRVLLELEFESESEFKLRTRLSQDATASQTEIEVDDPRRVPEAGDHFKIDAEWLRLTAISGRRLSVQRGQRGTQAAVHSAGRLLHRGRPQVREIPIAVNLEQWNP